MFSLAMIFTEAKEKQREVTENSGDSGQVLCLSLSYSDFGIHEAVLSQISPNGLSLSLRIYCCCGLYLFSFVLLHYPVFKGWRMLRNKKILKNNYWSIIFSFGLLHSVHKQY
jgi:hypothetical protein